MTAVARFVGATIGGVALWASLPPRGWWWLVPAALVVLVAVITEEPLRRRLLLGGVFGLAWAVPSFWWAEAFTGWGYGLLALGQASFAAAVAGLTPTRGAAIALPGGLVLVEWFRWRWPLGGLPLSSPTLAQVDAPWATAAAYGGPLLLLLVAGVAATTVIAVWQRRQLMALAGVVVVAGAVLLPVTLPPAVGDVDVAVVQGGGVRGVPAVRGDLAAAFDRHLQTSQELPPGTDLVVWPEDVIDVPAPFASSTAARSLKALIGASTADYLVGVVEEEPERRFRNSAVVVSSAGAIVDRYEKRHRVPFGEFVPMRWLVGRVADLTLVPRDAIAGQGSPVVTAAGTQIGVMISFEGSFARYGRDATRTGAEILAIPTNAASYTGEDVPSQQLAAARLRALENGRDVVQAAPTGYSAIITADGAVSRRSALGAEAVLTGRMATRRGLTPYTRLGDLPVLVLASGLLLAGHRDRSRSRNPRGARPSGGDRHGFTPTSV